MFVGLIFGVFWFLVVMSWVLSLPYLTDWRKKTHPRDLYFCLTFI